MIPGPILDPNALIYMPYPRVNCLKTIPFTAAHTYIAHIWQYRPPPPGVNQSTLINLCFKNEAAGLFGILL